MNVVDLTLLVSIFSLVMRLMRVSRCLPVKSILVFIAMIRMGVTISSWKIEQEEKLTLMPLCRKKIRRRPGLNLHSAKDILRKYSDANLITSSGDYLFKQELIFK
ncbi:MAG: hypothetical protein ACLR0I_07095 [Streptococcus salivarius]